MQAALVLDTPRAPGWPLVGSLPNLAWQGVSYLERNHARLGDIYTLGAGPLSVVLLHHPDHARRVLVEHAANYTKQGTFWSSIRSLLGLGLPTSEGELWRSRRRMMNPQFRRQRIAQLGATMAETIDAKLAGWSKGPVRVGAHVSETAMAVIVRTMFGTGLGPDQAQTVKEAMAFSLDHMLQKIVTDALPAWIPVPGRRAHRHAVARIDEVLFQLIEQRRAEGGSHDDMLSMLLDMRDTDGSGLDDLSLRDEAMSMFIAGYETTAASVAWGMVRMALDPELAAPLVAEVDEVLGHRLPTPADVARLPTVSRFFQEALRLHGPVFFLAREAAEDDVIDGHQIAAGTMVVLMMDSIHRHPSTWEDPDRFDPDRFLEARSAHRHPTAWVPFGAGQRKCIGKGFAMMEGVFLLAMILQRFRLAPTPQTNLDPQFGLTRRPREQVSVRLIPR